MEFRCTCTSKHLINTYVSAPETTQPPTHWHAVSNLNACLCVFVCVRECIMTFLHQQFVESWWSESWRYSPHGREHICCINLSLTHTHAHTVKTINISAVLWISYLFIVKLKVAQVPVAVVCRYLPQSKLFWQCTSWSVKYHCWRTEEVTLN